MIEYYVKMRSSDNRPLRRNYNGQQMATNTSIMLEANKEVVIFK